jgi:AcrR family transcriptional regulator
MKLASSRAALSRPKQQAKAPDRRAARTKLQLREALVSLVMERGWNAVTVKDICGRANVGRSTLYLHFADKEDLLLSGFKNLETSLEAVRRGAPGRFAFAGQLFLHAQENLRLFRALVRTSTGRHVIAHLREVSTRLVAAELETVPSRTRSALQAQYIAGGLVELMVAWLEGPARPSAQELTETFLRLTRKVLA